MNQATSADWLDAWGSIIGGLAALIAVIYAAKQLRGLVKQLKQNNFTALLTLEIEMNARKHRVDEAAREVRLLKARNAENDEIVIQYEFLEGRLEDWFNLADRMAFCILNKYLREKDFKSEYFKYFESMVTCHPDWFGPDTIYSNIVKLGERWGFGPPGHFESIGRNQVRGDGERPNTADAP